MKLVPDPPDDDEDPGMRAVLEGQYAEQGKENLKRALDLNHQALVKDRIAWRKADQEAKERLAAEPLTDATDAEERGGWKPVDLRPVLDGTAPVVLPEIGRRHDGVPLLYRGKEHSIASEPECGKTWFALMQVIDLLKRGRRVLYVDFEDDERTIVGRLKTMGLLAARLTDEADQFRYVRPEGPHRIEWLEELLRFNNDAADLVIYDGVTEGMQLWSLDPLNQNAAAEWRRLLIKPAMALGAATLATDHVVKNREARGAYAIGAQHKLAGLNGAQFLMERVDPFGRGLKGRSKVLVSKDRNGGLRQHGNPVEGAPGMTYLGDLVGDATSGEMESLIFWPPRAEDQEDGVEEAEPKPVDLSKVVKQILASLASKDKPQTFNDISARVGFGATKIRQALAQLEDNGEIVVREGPNRSRLHSLPLTEVLADAA
jgi:hypothetical protein